MKLLALIAAGLVTAATPAVTQQDRTERVQFARGASSKAVRGTIRGYEGANYILGARAGQRMTVSLGTDNNFAYFNVWAPGAEEPMFIGSTSGKDFAATLPATGDYRIQVYLMRNAARRNEQANYRLNVAVR